MARGSNTFYDLHGTGFRSGLTGVIFKGREVAPAIKTGREGKEIAMPLLLAAMALLAAELFVAQRREGEVA